MMSIESALVLVAGAAALPAIAMWAGYSWGWRAASSSERIQSVVTDALTLALDSRGLNDFASQRASAKAEADAWREKAGAFQAAVAAAKDRSDAAAMPETCVYDGCDDEPTSSIVDTSGRVTGLCERHARRWAKLDEDERRRVRSGATS